MNAKALQAKYTKQVEELLKRPENRNCADCYAPGPTFASTNLGVFICMRCAGLHRKMGVHISKVKSVSHDAWQPDQVQFMSQTGNKKAHEKYLYKAPRATLETDNAAFDWIRRKYEKKEFLRPEGVVDDHESDDEDTGPAPSNAPPPQPVPAYAQQLSAVPMLSPPAGSTPPAMLSPSASGSGSFWGQPQAQGQGQGQQGQAQMFHQQPQYAPAQQQPQAQVYHQQQQFAPMQQSQPQAQVYHQQPQYAPAQQQGQGQGQGQQGQAQVFHQQPQFAPAQQQPQAQMFHQQQQFAPMQQSQPQAQIHHQQPQFAPAQQQQPQQQQQQQQHDPFSFMTAPAAQPKQQAPPKDELLSLYNKPITPVAQPPQTHQQPIYVMQPGGGLVMLPPGTQYAAQPSPYGQQQPAVNYGQPAQYQQSGGWK